MGHGEKSPPRKNLLPQLLRLNCQQKDRSPEVSKCTTENPGQEEPGKSSEAAGTVMQQEAAVNMTQGPPHANTAWKGQVSWGLTCFYYIFLLLMYSKEVSFLLVFLWLAGILVLDAERHIRYIGWKASVQNEVCTPALLGQRISVLIFAVKLNSIYSLEKLYSLTTLMLYQCHLESTLLVAATALSNHVSSFIGSHQKTLPCHLIFFCYSIAEEDSITSFFILRNAYC